MNYFKGNNPFEAHPKDTKKSRYDYDSISISHDAITRGTENSFKESR
ncbi:MAG: hypothetical protein RR840_08275 [Clostridium sp.]